MNTSQLVNDLVEARILARPLSWDSQTPAGLRQGYEAALQVRARRIEAGEKPVGYKIGFTNRTIWPRYEVYAPIWGTVWDSGLRCADSQNGINAGELDLDGLCEPRIEPEIVFCLREAPPAACSLAQLAGCIAWLAHGYEIVHTHFPGWKFTAGQAVADGSLHGRLLVGERIDVPADMPVDALVTDLAGLQVRLFKGDELEDEGVGANVLDGPLQALLYFVNELRELPDAPALKAGDLVTTGTITDAHPVKPGDTWHTELSATGPLASRLKGLKVTFN
ncbi:MAG: hydratase [Comamonadaceae bacterium]|nr:MAG: hydratase [Comamonadaceae bacterium]